ncbi:MAG: glycoside hydrolase family 18 protein [Oscillospiraceae bacterium]|nr:glycoside hydrolase family 18 protein [Oscillospiraceae bacterium]
MQIHVVQAGQNLTGIAKIYNSTVKAIALANELPNPDRLVTGQALVIPIVGSYYWVQPGDSLYKIALRFQTTYQTIAKINNIKPEKPLSIGFKLYIPPLPKRSAEINAYAEPATGIVSSSLEQSVREAAPLLTYLAPFSFQIKRDGSLKEPPLNNFREIADNSGAIQLMAVTNIEDGQFSTELGRVILTDDALQNTLIDNIISTATRLDFKDIHFDLEHLPPELREDYNTFLRKAKARLSPKGFLMSTALAPKVSATQKGSWYEAHDYKVHGQVSDFVVIMTYEWGYSGGPAMPVSPLPQVKRVIEYALTEIPASKIMMGQNLYGYDWTLPFVKGSTARAISPQTAILLAADNKVSISYDTTAQAPYFDYMDTNRKRHTVWFEDARSIQAKFNLIKELALRGISYWKLGIPFPQNWLLIKDNFDVVKR